nr:hypothetical protein [Butyrivibrio sp. XPD2002]
MIGILDVVFGFPAPIIFALLLNEVKKLNTRSWYRLFHTCRTSFQWLLYAGFTDEVLKSQGYNEDDNFNIVATCAPVMKEGDTPEIGYSTSELVKDRWVSRQQQRILSLHADILITGTHLR